MRLIYLAMAVLAVVLLLIYLGHVVPIFVAPAENPLNAKLSVNTTSALRLYIAALGLISSGNYSGASHVLEVMASSSIVRTASVLSELYVHENRLAGLMAELEGVYEDAMLQVITGNLTGARYLAIKGLTLDSEAYSELKTIEGLMMGVAPNGEVMSAISSVRQKLVSFNETFIDILYSPLETNLTLAVSPDIVVVGGYVTAFGRLTMVNGTAIPNATITIYVDNEIGGSAVTNASGYYMVNVSIPYIYKPTLTIKATFSPSPGMRYLPSQAITNITVLYNTTYVNINYTASVMWGDPINVSGFVGGPSSRVIIIGLDGVNYTLVTVNNQLLLSIPTGNITPGNYSLLIYVPPNSTYSPVNLAYPVSVYSMAAVPSVKVSGPVISGLPIVVSGNITPWVYGLPITVSLESSAVSLNLTSPNFTVTLPTSPFLGMGFHDVVITVGSVPPISGGYYVYKVLVLNPIEMALPAIAVIAAFIFVRFRVGGPRRGGVTQEQQPQPEVAMGSLVVHRPVGAEVVERELVRLVPVGKMSIEGVREIVKALSKAVASVSARTGVVLRPTETLREYLASVRGKLDAQEYAALSELVGIAEYALYSPYTPSQAQVGRAWELAEVLSR